MYEKAAKLSSLDADKEFCNAAIGRLWDFHEVHIIPHKLLKTPLEVEYRGSWMLSSVNPRRRLQGLLKFPVELPSDSAVVRTAYIHGILVDKWKASLRTECSVLSG